MTKKDEIEYPIWIDESARTINGKIWIRGDGRIPATYMFVGERPTEDEVRDKKVFRGAIGRFVRDRLALNGFDLSDCYWTNAVKYPLPRYKSVTARDIKTCRPMLAEEIARVAPRIVVCLGSHALKAVAGGDTRLASIRGEFIAHAESDAQVFAMHGPGYLLRNADALPAFDRDILELVHAQRGGIPRRDTVEWREIRSVAALREFVDSMFKMFPRPILVIDMEWHGKHWQDNSRYIRTIQIGYEKGKAVIVNMRGPNGVPAMDNEPEAWSIVKGLLEDPRIGIVGHNVIADGHWLLGQGIDIRPRVVWDTMLAEFLLRETGPWDLGEVALKYTNHRRYALELETWVGERGAECAHGFGPVPENILFPYGAVDVDAPRTIAEKQCETIVREYPDFMRARGVHGEYPSLWRTTMRTQELVYELERSGMAVDIDRVESLIAAYRDVRAHLLGLVTTEAAQRGFADFNPASVRDTQKLLFQVLNLSPIKTTRGKEWKDWVGNQGLDNPTDNTPSTDQTTLEILQDSDPIVKHILYFRRVDQICKTLLRRPCEGEDEVSRGGGLLSKIWPDGRIHAHFSQLAETGRFRTSKPNVQNFPKKAENYMVEIFGGKDKIPPPIRSVIVPAKGCVLIESDFVQAELFVLAALSGDRTMMDALTTPGKDMHDITAISAFKLRVIDATGADVPESTLIALAAAHIDKGGADSEEFKSYIKTLRYVDSRGKVMTRDEFKNTIRVSAKNVNFGIPYGRGASDIARQVKAETGSSQPIQELQTKLAEIVETWKTETYPTAWEYMRTCANSVYDPGYLRNPWGRFRRFHRVKHNEERDDLERQAQNFPIQSTVADTAMLAMDLIARHRELRGLHFRIVNQIHDAIMLETPYNEIDACKQLLKDTMGAIDIPVGPPFNTLRLRIDITTLTRWGVEV